MYTYPEVSRTSSFCFDCLYRPKVPWNKSCNTINKSCYMSKTIYQPISSKESCTFLIVGSFPVVNCNGRLIFAVGNHVFVLWLCWYGEPRRDHVSLGSVTGTRLASSREVSHHVASAGETLIPQTKPEQEPTTFVFDNRIPLRQALYLLSLLLLKAQLYNCVCRQQNPKFSTANAKSRLCSRPNVMQLRIIFLYRSLYSTGKIINNYCNIIITWLGYIHGLLFHPPTLQLIIVAYNVNINQ